MILGKTTTFDPATIATTGTTLGAINIGDGCIGVLLEATGATTNGTNNVTLTASLSDDGTNALATGSPILYYTGVSGRADNNGGVGPIKRYGFLDDGNGPGGTVNPLFAQLPLPAKKLLIKATAAVAAISTVTVSATPVYGRDFGAARIQ